MMHRWSGLILLITLLLVANGAWAQQLELELEPGRLATPLLLPRGASIDDLIIEPDSVEALDPTPQPASRLFTVAGYPIRLTPAATASPIRVRQVTVQGRRVALLSAQDAGSLGPLRVRVTLNGGDGVAALGPVPVGWRASLPEPEPRLAIVTTGRVAERSLELERYIRWRRAGGFDVVLGTEEQWDLPVAEGEDRRADRIRAWLRSVRDEGGLGYVLLIGSPEPRMGSVPMQPTHPMSELLAYMPSELIEALDPVPTDHFYSDLDGDWDLDGDGRLGEYPDDDGEGGIRWDGGVMVGRIPIYGEDSERLDQILLAIIDYESSENPAYRRRVLLPAAFIGFEGSPSPGGGVYEETIDAATAAQSVFDVVTSLDDAAEISRLYEDEGIVPSAIEHELGLNVENLVGEWSRGAGLVVAYAHGSTQGLYRTVWMDDGNSDGVPNGMELFQGAYITSDDIGSLGRSGGAFTFHAACENGWPEDPNNLGAALLARGAIATVSASRAAIGGESEFEPAPNLGDADTLAYAFAHLLLEGLRAGEIMAYLRYGIPADGWGEEAGLPLNGYGWIGKLEYNLYGDPTSSLGRCNQDDDCNDGSLCNGVGRCLDGYCVQGALVDCSHLDDDCQRGECEPTTGSCHLVPRDAGTACDDGLFCTVDDACLDGICGGAPRSCGEAPSGYVAVCDEAARQCLLDVVGAPDAGVGDSGFDAGDVDGGTSDEAGLETPSFDAGGGGCSLTRRRSGLSLIELLRGL